MKITIACCDDEKEQILYYKKMFSNLEIRFDVEFEVEYFLSGDFLLERFQKEKHPFDIVFLDMEMPHMSGLDVARGIRELRGRDTLIIFLTSFAEYMQDSFNVRAFQYMVKPVSFEEFERKLKDALDYVIKDEKNIIVFKVEEDDVVVRASDVLYIEKQKSAKRISVQMEKDILYAKGNMNAVEEKLKKMNFVRTHRTFIVNLKHIKRIRKSEVVLSNGETVPVSRRKEAEIKEYFMKYAILERK